MNLNRTNKEFIYLTQITIFASLVYLGPHGINLLDILSWGTLERIAQFVIYLLTIKVTEDIITLIYHNVQTGTNNLSPILLEYKTRLALITTSVAVALFAGFWVFDEDFLFITVASFLVNYKEKTMSESAQAEMAAGTKEGTGVPGTGVRGTPISYGSGMACSFFEGYLRHILPPDENEYEGFKGAIKTYESNEKVRFPVHQLFLVITKSLHCPPSLAFFNKENRPDLPRIEACKSLEDVKKNVAGVQRRIYRNSAYQIQRSNRRPVYLAVECATPLHTLHKVLTNKALYDELLLNPNADEIREDFCTMLENILRKSVDCRGKCTLVYYDDKDPEQNLADLLLKKIEELAPNFEEIILDVQRD